jgi:hypothetical protein
MTYNALAASIRNTHMHTIDSRRSDNDSELHRTYLTSTRNVLLDKRREDRFWENVLVAPLSLVSP